MVVTNECFDNLEAFAVRGIISFVASINGQLSA